MWATPFSDEEKNQIDMDFLRKLCDKSGSSSSLEKCCQEAKMHCAVAQCCLSRNVENIERFGNQRQGSNFDLQYEYWCIFISLSFPIW